MFRRKFKPIPIAFDIKGRSAGLYSVRQGKRCIRYNPFVFTKYFDESLRTTVPHEVAHYIADMLYGFGNIKPHGPQWRDIMIAFGVQPRVTNNFDLSDVPVRRQRRFPYRCACTSHLLTTVRHNRLQRGIAAYFCRMCGTQMEYDTGNTVEQVS